MKNKSGCIIYAFTGGNGSGKTTYAQKISKEKGSVFFSLDKTIKDFNEVIQSYEDYMAFYQKALDIISEQAVAVLKEGGSVVFDFGGGISSRLWLKGIAKSTGAETIIFHLEVSLEERRRRIRQRNLDKDRNIYFFNMSDEEFDRHNKIDSPAPPEEAGIKVIKVNN